MKMNRMTLAASFTLICVASLSAALTSSCSCNRDPKSTLGTETQISSKAPQGSHPALQFDYKKTAELLIAKSDPASGDRWAARIQRDGIPSPENENLWTIEMGPDSLASGDRKAHGEFILHLLDTIRSIQVKEAPVSGSPESFGLASPLFVLRWRVAEARSSADTSSSTGNSGAVRAQVFKTYEVRLGAPVKGDDGKFQGLYASFGGVPNKVFIVQGAMLQMLDMITSFQTLRLPTVTTITSDDVDELEVSRAASKTRFYAQRENGGWTDAKHRAVKKDVDAFLDQLTHLRVLRFIDDAREKIKTESLLTRSSAHTIVFKDLHGKACTLKLYALSGGKKAYATFSTRERPSASASQKSESLAVFEVYPEIFKSLTQF